MIASSSVSAEASAYIAGRLAELAADRGVRILFAIESGSRAWGFPSADSDYDVRFVYARPRGDYLSVREFRDVIETPLVDDPALGVPFDLNGWDVQKALRLALTSNPVLHEWLVSPVVYATDGPAVAVLRAFVAEAADHAVYRYHYDRLCRSAWMQLKANAEKATVKRYCYALRPALMLKWLATRDDLPPMDVLGLSDGLKLSEDIVSAMASLFAQKRSGGEKDTVAGVAALDALVADALREEAPRPNRIDITNHPLLTEADALFLTVLGNADI
jgi:hypothetical protein